MGDCRVCGNAPATTPDCILESMTSGCVGLSGGEPPGSAHRPTRRRDLTLEEGGEEARTRVIAPDVASALAPLLRRQSIWSAAVPVFQLRCVSGM